MANNFWLNALANAIIVSGVSMNYSLLIVLVNESLPNKTRKKASIVLFIIEVSGYVIFTLIEMF